MNTQLHTSFHREKGSRKVKDKSLEEKQLCLKQFIILITLRGLWQVPWLCKSNNTILKRGFLEENLGGRSPWVNSSSSQSIRWTLVLCFPVPFVGYSICAMQSLSFSGPPPFECGLNCPRSRFIGNHVGDGFIDPWTIILNQVVTSKFSRFHSWLRHACLESSASTEILIIELWLSQTNMCLDPRWCYGYRVKDFSKTKKDRLVMLKQAPQLISLKLLIVFRYSLKIAYDFIGNELMTLKFMHVESRSIIEKISLIDKLKAFEEVHLRYTTLAQVFVVEPSLELFALRAKMYLVVHSIQDELQATLKLTPTCRGGYLQRDSDNQVSLMLKSGVLTTAYALPRSSNHRRDVAASLLRVPPSRAAKDNREWLF
ncbi:hypothetical protein Fmac_032574 [Flemingia macrophylla]|uniref:Uncharacterized protein n=1 Tax=Flemingia macrophylla TaxID=520843 RepID=A0ABD1L5R2_9FABA